MARKGWDCRACRWNGIFAMYPVSFIIFTFITIVGYPLPSPFTFFVQFKVVMFLTLVQVLLTNIPTSASLLPSESPTKATKTPARRLTTGVHSTVALEFSKALYALRCLLTSRRDVFPAKRCVPAAHEGREGTRNGGQGR